MKSYEVKLNSDAVPYTSVRLHASFSDLNNWEVVEVQASKLLGIWRQSPREQDFLIPPVNQWKPSKKNAITDLFSDESSIEMPQVGCEIIEVQISKFLGLGKQKTICLNIAFSNGRHRAVFLHDHGAQTFPVECESSSANLLREACGIPTK